MLGYDEAYNERYENRKKQRGITVTVKVDNVFTTSVLDNKSGWLNFLNQTTLS